MKYTRYRYHSIGNLIFNSVKSKFLKFEFNAYAKIKKIRSTNSDFKASFKCVMYMTHMHNSSQLWFNQTK